MSFGDALRVRICEPLGMKDTAFSVGGASVSRLATAYERDDATGEVVVQDGPDGGGQAADEGDRPLPWRDELPESVLGGARPVHSQRSRTRPHRAGAGQL